MSPLTCHRGKVMPIVIGRTMVLLAIENWREKLERGDIVALIALVTL